MKIKRAKTTVAIELMPLSELCQRLEDRRRFRLQGMGLKTAVRMRFFDDAGFQSPDERKNNFGFRAQMCSKFFLERRESFLEFYQSRLIRDIRHGRRANHPLQPRQSALHLEQQHFEADEAFAELRALAENGCPRTLRDNFARFEHSLHEQIYEENRVLSPRALAVSRA